MEKVKLALKSRTVWTIIVLFVINGVEGIKGYIPVDWLPLINGLLSIAAIYFKVKPSQRYE